MADNRAYVIVYEHHAGGDEERSLMVGIGSNGDVHFRVDSPGVAAQSHTLVMADFDALVERVHEHHAEVRDEQA